MTADAEVLAALDFEPALCWMRTCTTEAITIARPACGCWEWRLCGKHDEWMRGLLAGATYAYCRTCRRSSPVSLEEL